MKLVTALLLTALALPSLAQEKRQTPRDAMVAEADAATARWTRELLARRTLAAALDAVVCDGNLHGNDTVEPGEANDAGFDFGSWLAMAITSGWLHRVVDVVGGVDGGLCAHGEARQRNSVND